MRDMNVSQVWDMWRNIR